ncbi:MAG: DHH family phosphoesterase [Oscillospiraceae bacterium]|nr:DHH family phosphoesterase [Oscillospiraceae bacterium]MBP1570362.1 DHH family phosphoesterase [Oscillospiraceae bacterium]MBQ5324215.1 DHH family phosphoesterase [Oscillospiraceae bacterium]
MKNRFISTDLLILILTVASAAFAIAAAIVNPAAAGIVAAGLLVVLLVLGSNAKATRKIVKSIFYGSGKHSNLQQLSFEKLNIPVAIISKDTIVWYNDSFREKLLGGNDSYLIQAEKVLPGFDVEKSCSENGFDVVVEGREYTVFSSTPTSETKLWVSYFVDDTQYKIDQREYHMSRPVIMQIAVDTYDDVLKDLKESTRAQIMAKLDQMIEDAALRNKGLINKYGTSRYTVVLEERNYPEFASGQFDILSEAKKIGGEYSVTLSVGVGKGGVDFAENDALSRQALDMALGRGGDQAVVKTQDGYEFFGGNSRSVEKRSKVRSRIVANALKDIILQSEQVLVMGHKMSDLDSVGSAVGMAAIVKALDRKVHIVIDENRTLAGNLIDWVKTEEGHENLFITPERAQQLVDYHTLLILVDNHTAKMAEDTYLCELCSKKVIIDHHRKMVDYISDTVVSYHEPYASSASELVTELIQYMLPVNAKLTPVESGAMLSGIMLDTRNFSEKAGVRTFEAAAYLRRQYVDMSTIIKLFAVPKEIYEAKACLVNKAETYKGVAISMSDQFSDEVQLAVPQAANDLLTLEGVEASVVALMVNDTIRVSARSLGGMNVQVLMEYLGGGGHLTMAGAQLKDMTLEQAKEKIYESIDNYKR